MTGLQIFHSEQFGDIRSVCDNGKPLFCGMDVATALGYTNPRKAMIDHCKGVTKRDTLTNGGVQSLTYIPEGDVYRLITHSRLPEAQRFEGWVFDEVLPTIRRHGAYAVDEILNDPDSFIAVLQQLKKERQEKAQLERENEEMKPKALFADAVETSSQSILIGELAKIIRQNGFEIGQNRLFRWMRENGYILKHKNIPSQYSMELGLMEIKERTINNPDGSVAITQTCKVTGKGQQYFINKLLGGTKIDI